MFCVGLIILEWSLFMRTRVVLSWPPLKWHHKCLSITYNSSVLICMRLLWSCECRVAQTVRGVAARAVALERRLIGQPVSCSTHRINVIFLRCKQRQKTFFYLLGLVFVLDFDITTSLYFFNLIIVAMRANQTINVLCCVFGLVLVFTLIFHCDACS